MYIVVVVYSMVESSEDTCLNRTDKMEMVVVVFDG